MFSLAWQTMRARRGSFAAAFVAVFFGSVLITASGVLLDSGQRAGIPPQRYVATPVVVTAPQELSVVENLDQRFAERVPLSTDLAAKVAAVDGVRSAIGDVTVKAGVRTTSGSIPVSTHGWSSVQLGQGLVDGHAPAAPDEIVLGADLGVRTGDTVDLEIGAVATKYRVTGIAGQSGAFVTDEQARRISGRPDQVDAVAVFGDPGVGADDLATRIHRAVPGVVTFVGNDRAEAEFLDVGSARSFLTLMAGSFGGTMLLIVLLVVSSTLGLSVQQRRREFALLRAIAAEPRQIYRLIGVEAGLLASVAAVLGAAPGVGLSLLLRDALADFGAIPPDFEFVIGPLPILAAVVASVLSAVLAGMVAARRAARISPASALGEAAVEPPKLGRGRIIAGWVLVVIGVASGVLLPMRLSGTAAAGGAASSALLLVIAVALLGPQLLVVTAQALGALGLRRPASGFLAGLNARARSRRLGSATTPLIMGMALAAVQVFTMTTTTGAAERQTDEGVVADRVLVAQQGIAPGIADSVRRVPGVAAATPVARTQVLVSYKEFGEPAVEAYAAQGVTPDGLDKTLNLDVRRGDFTGLTEGTVAVSEFAANTFGVDVGGMLTMHLGDGSPYAARVVAVYGRGLGFGDVTLPNDTVVRHRTDRLDDQILVAATPGTAPEALDTALRSALAPYPEVRLGDRDSFTTTVKRTSEGQASVNLLLNLVLLAFIAIAVVNILVLATAARVREFALLRLAGAKPRQVRAMMRGEAGIVVTASVVLGSLAAIPPLAGISLSLTGSVVPTVPPLVYLAIVAVAVALGWASIAVPTRVAMRPAPVDAMRTGE